MVCCIIPRKQESICFNQWSYLKYSGNSNRCSTGFCFGPLLFLLYINDLKKSIKNLRAYHFADDTNILLSNKKPGLLAQKNEPRSQKSFTMIKSNQASFLRMLKRLKSFQGEKIFHPKNFKLDYGIKFKLNWRRLTPISTVKYLAVLLNEHLLWTKQVNWVNSKLNQTTGSLSKLR